MIANGHPSFIDDDGVHIPFEGVVDKEWRNGNDGREMHSLLNLVCLEPSRLGVARVSALLTELWSFRDSHWFTDDEFGRHN